VSRTTRLSSSLLSPTGLDGRLHPDSRQRTRDITSGLSLERCLVQGRGEPVQHLKELGVLTIEPGVIAFLTVGPQVGSEVRLARVVSDRLNQSKHEGASTPSTLWTSCCTSAISSFKSSMLISDQRHALGR